MYACVVFVGVIVLTWIDGLGRCDVYGLAVIVCFCLAFVGYEGG